MSAFDQETIDQMAVTLRAALSSDSELAAVLYELGWDEVLAVDPIEPMKMLFLELGRSARASTILDSVVLGSWSGDASRQGTKHSVLYPFTGHSAVASVTETDHSVVLRGVILGAPDETATALAPVIVDGQCSVAAITLTHADLINRGGWDLESSGFIVDVEVSTEKLRASIVDNAPWELGESAGRRAVAQELVGLSQSMLKLAVEHVKNREQFNRPIGSFQSVRHRLAEAHVWIVSAQGLIDDAWSDTSDGWLSAASAKAYAGKTHREVARQTLQVCGAIGLTWEFPLHRFVRRGFALDQLFGGEGHQESELGERLFLEASLRSSNDILLDSEYRIA